MTISVKRTRATLSVALIATVATPLIYLSLALSLARLDRRAVDEASIA